MQSTSQQKCANVLAEKMVGLSKFKGNIWVRVKEDLHELEITFDRNKHPVETDPDRHFINIYWRNAPGDGQGRIDDSRGNRHHHSPNLTDGFYNAAKLVPEHAVPLLETLVVHADQNCIDPQSDLYAITMSAFNELFPHEDSQPKKNISKLSPFQCRHDIQEKRFLDLLAEGEQGIKQWATLYRNPVKLVVMTGLDFQDRQFKSFDFGQLSLASCNFNRAILNEATFSSADISKSTFVDCELEKAYLYGCRAESVDFSGSKMQHCILSGANLRNAKFKGCDLSNARLDETDLTGADLSDCILSGALLTKAKYNEKTKLPDNLMQWKMMKWKGKGADPYKEWLKQSTAYTATALGAIDIKQLMTFLQTNIEKSRLSKAVSMLKKEKFQLFSDTTEDSLHGVVRSQTDLDLVYACHLNAKGEFACCTQNLNACGGLKGALCKHLLVLVIGLAQAEAINPTNAALWVLKSITEKPKIDKDAMTDVFLKYKKAEAGEIDWRPTETMPEDYYAF